MGLSRDLSAEVGRNVRRIRNTHGAAQSDLVYAAQRFGLGWTQSTVAKVEAGTRGLTAEEFVVLPLVVGDAVADQVLLRDLVGEDFQLDAGQVLLGGGAVRSLVSGEALQIGYGDTDGNVSTGGTTVARFTRSRGEVDKLAHLLGTDAASVDAAAQKLWGHAALDERLRREEDAELHTLDHRSRHAVRGHITRALVHGLRQVLEGGQS